MRYVLALVAALVVIAVCVSLLPPSGGRRGKRLQPPEWASFFTAKQYQRFIKLVRAYFQERGREIVVEGGVVTCAGQGEDSQKLGLVNLAQTCNLEPPDSWAGIIEEHFDSAAASFDRIDELDDITFERARDLLAVRIWPKDFLENVGPDGMIWRCDLEGTVTALVLDLPETIVNVKPQQASSWGKTAEELFDLALENVRRNCVPQVFEDDAIDGARITLFHGDSFFIATHALLPKDHPQCLGRHGSLVGVPNRHALLCCPVENLAVIRAIEKMAAGVSGMEKAGPGSISPLLYWYHDGRFTTLPYELEGNELHLTPPEEFVEVLNKLPPADEQN